MMFGFGQKTFIGVDIGTSSIKIVELKVLDGKPYLSNYAWAALPNDASGKDDLNSVFFNILIPKFLEKMVKESKLKITSADAYISIPAAGGLITLIDFPVMAREDMEQAIKFEAHKYIPTSLDDVTLCWDIVGSQSPEKKNVEKSLLEEKDGNSGDSNNQVSAERNQVLLVAASKNKVLKYDTIVKSAGFKVRAIELESFSLVNSLIGNDPGTFILVDIGHRLCNILLVEKGIIKVNRNIDAGGRDLTRTISKSMGIDEERSEKLKVSEKNFFSKESAVQFGTLEVISSEILRIINSYMASNDSIRIDGVVLSGGTANLYGIKEYFSNVLNLRTIVGNPFSRVGYDKKLQPIVSSNLGPRFSVCLGLALKGIDDVNIKNK